MDVGINTGSSLGEQDELFRQLEALSQRQRRLIDEGDIQGVVTVITQRRALTDRLAEALRHMAKERVQMQAGQRFLAAGGSADADESLRRLRVRLERLIASDGDDMRLLTMRKAVVANALHEDRCFGAAVQAYQSSGVDESSGRLAEVEG